jgi:hypothetical protein
LRHEARFGPAAPELADETGGDDRQVGDRREQVLGPDRVELAEER